MPHVLTAHSAALNRTLLLLLWFRLGMVGGTKGFDKSQTSATHLPSDWKPAEQAPEGPDIQNANACLLLQSKKKYAETDENAIVFSLPRLWKQRKKTCLFHMDLDWLLCVFLQSLSQLDNSGSVPWERIANQNCSETFHEILRNVLLGGDCSRPVLLATAKCNWKLSHFSWQSQHHAQHSSTRS